MGIVQHLLVLYCSAGLINLIIAGVMWRRQRTELNRTLFLVWAAALLAMVIQGVLARQGPLLVVLSFSSTFLVNLALASFLCGLAGVGLAWRGYTALLAVGLGCAVATSLAGGAFWIIALPVAITVAAPGLHTALRVLLRHRRTLTTAGAGLAVTCIVFGLHNLDYALLRDKPQLETLGFTIALLIVFALSITAPAAVLERVAAERAAFVELDRLKTRLFTNITHELRTPLTMILAPVEVLLEGSGQLSSEQRTYLESVAGHGMKLLKSINDLLDMARLEEGHFTLMVRRDNFAERLRDIIDHSQPLAARKNIDLTGQLECQVADLHVDGHQLERVVINLIANALKFTPAGGEVRVRLYEHGDEVALAVSDTGCGIPEDRLERIFDRFMQADAAVSLRYGGSGIGLAFAREIIELHGGRIDIASKPGAGTTVVAHLKRGTAHFDPALLADAERTQSPLGDSGAPDLDWAQQLAGRADYRFMDIEQATDRRRVRRLADPGQGPKVLVVDDNIEILRFVQTLLGQAHSVYVAENGEQGLELARRELPDLIVTDYMMPKMDGLQMMQALRQSKATAAIPVIMLTAKDRMESRVAAREHGADAYLGKPFSPRELQMTVAKLLEKRGQQVSAVADAQVQGLASVAAGLAHEINNPLSYIKNSLVVIGEKAHTIAERSAAAGEVDPVIAKARQRIERMSGVAERGLERIQNVVGLLRQYAREGYPTEPSQFAFDEAVRKVLAFIAPKDGAARELTTDLQAGDAPIRCIPEELHQAIGNVVQNALDACEHRVEVSSRHEDGSVVFRVTDDGPGIPKELEARIFAPFFSTKEPGQGMGLGLAITRQVVTRAGGSIVALPAAPRGTTFELRLPSVTG